MTGDTRCVTSFASGPFRFSGKDERPVPRKPSSPRRPASGSRSRRRIPNRAGRPAPLRAEGPFSVAGCGREPRRVGSPPPHSQPDGPGSSSCCPCPGAAPWNPRCSAPWSSPTRPVAPRIPLPDRRLPHLSQRIYDAGGILVWALLSERKREKRTGWSGPCVVDSHAEYTDELRRSWADWGSTGHPEQVSLRVDCSGGGDDRATMARNSAVRTTLVTALALESIPDGHLSRDARWSSAVTGRQDPGPGPISGSTQMGLRSPPLGWHTLDFLPGRRSALLAAPEISRRLGRDGQGGWRGPHAVVDSGRLRLWRFGSGSVVCPGQRVV